jgi:splicing factor 3B subunit 5
MHRDSYASYIGHHNMIMYFSTVENESVGRVKYEFLQKMLLPCGLPPKPADAAEEGEEAE